ncbi:tetratricopeptide repeat protein [Pseudomonas fluorescens]|uniref:Tetratricopeptide repeat protein n=1 Tax=Pseudomonas fluorescens TaxID=294 RepID=A0A5E7ALR4_PSEFL|nr:tetratricopeptide repeat protein [Pseudomonas fluorescens]VVN79559.1 hypothetical protein PS704_00992 [Pseudomonas fluorescens]
MKFVGRENELRILRKAWNNALAGDQQVVVLVAESRFGKTRIVQEFYHWLNQKCDPANYWPDNLPRDNDSLHINPLFSEQYLGEAEPPWLWWGIRWCRPGLRNTGQVDQCAVISGADYLVPHIESAIRLERRRSTEKAIVKSVRKSAVDIVDNFVTGGLVSAAVNIWEHASEWLDLRKHSRMDERNVVLKRAERTGGELDQLSTLLLSMVGSGAITPDGLPLVLILDDVHWADAESLQFIQRLLRELKNRGNTSSCIPVKVLVIATSWEREWVEANARPLSNLCDAHPSSFSEVIRAIQREIPTRSRKRFRTTEYFLKRVDEDLRYAVEQSLPGLTATQIALIAERAGGCPGLLVELIIKLTHRSRHLFENSNVMEKLTDRGEIALKAMSVDYHELVEERLQDLNDQELTVLRLASYQGSTYSQSFVQELASRLDHVGSETSLNLQTVDTVFLRANNPLALVQPIAERLDEFRLPIYRDVLHRQLEESDWLWRCIEVHMFEQIVQWIAPGKLAALSQPVRRAFLSFAASEAFARFNQCAMEENRLTLLIIWSEQLRDLLLDGRIAPLACLVESWLSLWKSGTGTEMLAGLGSERVVFVLHAMRNTDRMEDCKVVCLAGLELLPLPSTSESMSSMREVLLEFATVAAKETDNPQEGLLYAEAALAEAIDAIERYGETADRLHALAATKSLLAGLHIEMSELELGVNLLRESVVTCEGIVDDFGESAQRLADVSKLKADLASALQQKDDNSTAIKLLDEALKIAERVIAAFGEHADWLMNIAEIKERLANVKVDVDQTEQAALLLQQSMEIREQVLRDYGVNWRRLRAVSITKGMIGGALMREGKAELAYARFCESIVTSEQALREYGPSILRMNDVGIAKFRAADALMMLDKADQALVLYQESLAIAQAITAQSQSNARLLGSLYLCHFRIGSLLFDRGELTEASKAFEQALAICERVTREHSQNYSSLRDVSLCKGKLVDVLLARNEVSAALEILQEVVEMDSCALQVFGASRMRLIDVAASSITLGDLYLRQDRFAEAEKVYRRALEINERIAGECSPGALHPRRLAISRNRIGNVLLLMDQQDLALKYFSEALEDAQHIIDELGATAEMLRDLAVSKCRLGELYVLQEKPESALGLFIEALEIFEEVRGISGSWPQTFDDVFLLKGRVGDMNLALGDISSADRIFTEGLEMAGQFIQTYGEVPAFPGRMAMSLRRVAQSQLRQGRASDAIILLEQALAMVEGHPDSDPGGDNEPDMDSALIKDLLAEGFLQSGDIERAEQQAVESMGAYDLSAISGYVPPERTHELLLSRKRLGQLFSDQGRTEMSMRILRSSTRPILQ